MISTVKEINNETSILGLQVMKLDTFQDHRGEIWTVYSEDYCDDTFVSDKITISGFGVLRGFHGDTHTVKLITCLHGQIQLAVTDLRKDSETYGNVETFFITDHEPTIIIVPAGCVNAHLSLSEKCVFYYKWSEHYQGPDSQATVAWDDPDLNVDWAIKNPILSERDKNGVSHKAVYL